MKNLQVMNDNISSYRDIDKAKEYFSHKGINVFIENNVLSFGSITKDEETIIRNELIKFCNGKPPFSVGYKICKEDNANKNIVAAEQNNTVDLKALFGI